MWKSVKIDDRMERIFFINLQKLIKINKSNICCFCNCVEWLRNELFYARQWWQANYWVKLYNFNGSGYDNKQLR